MLVFKLNEIIRYVICFLALTQVNIVFAKTNCQNNLSLSDAKVIVNKYKERIKIPKNSSKKKRKVTFKKSNMGCHYYYKEISEYSAHLNRVFILDFSGEVVDYFSTPHAINKKLNCPVMAFKSEYFFEQLKKHKLFLKRKIDRTQLNLVRCKYDYTVSFLDKIEPAGATFYFDYKGQVISWSPIGEKYLKYFLD